MSDAAKAAITNIFVLMLENHSFDNMLGRSGIPGLRVAPADASNSYDGQTYKVKSPAPWCMTTDPGHELLATLTRKLGMAPLTKRDTAAADLWPLLTESVPRSDCPTTLPDPVLPPRGSDYETVAAPDNRHEQPLPRSGNAVGFLHVLLKTEIELARKCGGRAAENIIADFRKIETHADASAYVGKVKAMLDAL